MAKNNPNPYPGPTGILWKDLWEDNLRFPSVVLPSSLILVPSIPQIWPLLEPDYPVLLTLSAVVFLFLILGGIASAVILSFELKSKWEFRLRRELEWEDLRMNEMSTR